jgi:hypothetical protein
MELFEDCGLGFGEPTAILSTAYGAIWHDQKLNAVAHNRATNGATEVLVESRRRFDSRILKHLQIG